MIDIQKYYIDDKEALSFVGTVSAIDYYGYNTTFGASAAPVWQESYCLTLFFYTDLSTNKLSFMAIASQHDDDIDGSVNFTISGLPSTAKLVVQDDQGEASLDSSTGTCTAVFRWIGCCTDGLAIDEINGFDKLTINITSTSNINKIKIISNDYSTKYIDITSLPFAVESTSETITINDYLSPRIPPGIYPSDQSVYFDFAPEVANILSTVNDNPVLAKYIAYDELTPPNPFIATVQDGKGNVLFDGGFPKFYNRYYNTSWSVFSDMDASFKYLANAMDFIANIDKVQEGNKNILVLGTANIGETYNILESEDTDFKIAFDGVSKIMGYNLTYKTRGDYTSGLLDPTLIELNNYCAVIIMSSTYSSDPYISDTAVTNLLLYRESGNGIFAITDHGLVLNDIEEARTFPYSASGFFCTINKLITNFGAYFSGDYDRNDVNVGFLRETYGDHPLYNNLLDSEYIHAGPSESKINITPSTIYTPSTFPSVNVTDGYSVISIMLILNDGNIITRNYTYGVNVPEIIHYFDPNNIEYSSNIELRSNPFIIDLQIDYSQTLTENIFGYIQHNNEVIGEFTYDGTSTNITYYSGFSNEIYMENGDTLRTLIISPLVYERTLYITIPLNITDYRKISKLTTDIIRDNNILEDITLNNLLPNLGTDSSTTDTYIIGDHHEKYMILLGINNKSKSKFYYKYPKLIKDIQNGII